MENSENDYILANCLKYLEILQEGRIKPDKTGKNSTVRDSLDNYPDIQGTKKRINQLLNIEVDDSRR